MPTSRDPHAHDAPRNKHKQKQKHPSPRKKNERNKFVSLTPVPPIKVVDPGMRTMQFNIQDVKDNDPELLAIVQQIKSNYLNFISDEDILLGEIEIVPCLVGSQSQRFHPEPILGNKPAQNDIDWEFFCFIKNPAALGPFIEQLFSKISIPDYFSNDHILNIRSISTHFNYSADINTNVDVKFTVFTAQKTEEMIYKSMSNRVICPKANIVKFPWNIEETPFITINYYANWLDFTTSPIHQDTKEYRPEFIAYALLFHYLNPNYPITNRFIYTITEFFKAAWLNTKLLELTKIKFVALCCKKFCSPGAITSEVSLKPGEEFAEIFTSISHQFFEPYGLHIINLIVQYRPDVVDFIPSVIVPPQPKTPTQTSVSADSEAQEIVVTPSSKNTNKLTFFLHYTNIDSFCDAVIRQFILMNSHRVRELGRNPMMLLKHKMLSDSSPVDMNQVFRKFNTEYPEINLIIYSSDLNILHIIKNDPSAAPSLTINLIQHGERYSPILAPQDAPLTRIIESQMSSIRFGEPW
jgi:hypothetical protein